MAVMRREHASAFFLGSAHAVTRCAKVDAWMAACDLMRVERYRSAWFPPSASGLTEATYRFEIGRFLENRGERTRWLNMALTQRTLRVSRDAAACTNCNLFHSPTLAPGTPCSPLRLAAHTENVSFCDCGLLHTIGGRCLSLSPSQSESAPVARIAGSRPHPWVGQRWADNADACSGSFNLDAMTHRNFWLRAPSRARLQGRAAAAHAG